MKSFSKTALPLLAALALTFGAASAQTAPTAQAGPGSRRQPSPQEMATHQTQHLSKKLGLSADQSAQVQQIMQQHAQDMQALRANAPASADRQQMRTQLQANRAKYDEQLKAVLTPDQFGKYAAMRDEHRHHGPRPDGKFKAKDGDLKIKSKTSQS
ncbi:MAG: hypothetical protein ACRYFK_03375 [Janthinobacterium lividum]